MTNSKEEAAGLAPTPGYRYADVVGHRLVLAGQVPHDAAGDLVGPGDVAAQVRQCLANLRSVVSVHGFEWTDIRRLTVYVVGDEDDLSARQRRRLEQPGGGAQGRPVARGACAGRSAVDGGRERRPFRRRAHADLDGRIEERHRAAIA